jgi:hypothetical protein
MDTTFNILFFVFAFVFGIIMNIFSTSRNTFLYNYDHYKILNEVFLINKALQDNDYKLQHELLELKLIIKTLQDNEHKLQTKLEELKLMIKNRKN